jgi:hypothetical protein
VNDQATSVSLANWSSMLAVYEHFRALTDLASARGKKLVSR